MTVSDGFIQHEGETTRCPPIQRACLSPAGHHYREFLMLYQSLWYIAFALALVSTSLLLRFIRLPVDSPRPVALEIHASPVRGARPLSTTRP